MDITGLHFLGRPAYDLGFFDEFARAAGWTERASLENPELRQPS